MPLPDTTTPTTSQHMKALAQANRVRLARAATKARIASGELEAAQVILEPGWEVESMTVFDLLHCQDRWGRTRIRRFLATTRMQEVRTLGSLTPRERQALAGRIRGQRVLDPFTVFAALGSLPAVTPEPEPKPVPVPLPAELEMVTWRFMDKTTVTETMIHWREAGQSMTLCSVDLLTVGSLEEPSCPRDRSARHCSRCEKAKAKRAVDGSR